jgi:diadenylate cyclase
VLEKETSLGEHAETGVALDAALSVDLIEQIFHPNTRLHDGAAIVRGDRIVAAACLLPLDERIGLDPQLGTRHRAALGISEQTDAVVIVVSEETGQISYAERGHLVRDVDDEQLRRHLLLRYGSSRSDDGPGIWPSYWRSSAPVGVTNIDRSGRVDQPSTLAERVSLWFGRGSSRAS